MENLDNSQWRSTYANSDNLDESATETINSSFLSCNTQKDIEDIDSEDGLLNAMNNLQITTAEKSEELNHSNITEQINIGRTNELPVEKIDSIQENTSKEDTKMSSTLNSLKTFIKARTPIKSKLAIPTKTTLLPPPELSKSKIINASLNTSISRNKNPKETDKRIIKTLVDTDDGIELREEKINHFSIPIIDGKKKRTEPIGFSFLSRVKKPVTKITNNNEVDKKVKIGIQQTNKVVSLNDQRKTVCRSQSALTINRNQNLLKSSEPLKTKLTSGTVKRSTTTSSLPAAKNTKNVKARVNILTTKKSNQENKPPCESEIIKPRIQHQSGKSLPPKLYTDQRAKKRHEFDVKLKQKEMEIEKIRLELEKKQREKEKLEELALRKTMEHKANPVPEFKVPAPIRSKKPLTEPQSPAWALKAKQAK